MMEIIKKVQLFIENSEPKRLYQYIGIFLFCIGIIMGTLIFRYSRRTTFLIKKINEVNELREEVKIILDKAEQVKQQRNEVDQMLAQDENFKIASYFKKLVEQHNLSNKKVQERISEADRIDNYRETVLNASFIDMTMQELTQLLQDIEENKRVYTKDIEITASKKKPKTIEVNLTIATLQPKVAETESVE